MGHYECSNCRKHYQYCKCDEEKNMATNLKTQSLVTSVTSYKTTDGKVFEHLSDAEAHQLKLTDHVKLKAEVKDLLNQILIKLKDIPRAEVTSDDDGYYSITNIPSEQGDLRYLAAVKDYCMSVTDQEYRAGYYSTHYYDSSCY